MTSGFIATPELLRDRSNLPQCDVLIVDRDTPPLMSFADSGIEVVPSEAVCGIIEVKRSLTATALHGPNADKGALGHLRSIVQSLGNESDFKTDKALNRFNRSVGLHNHSSDKPLLGVIALQNRVDDFSDVAKFVTDSSSLVDFVWCLDGHALLPAFVDGDSLQYYSHTARPVSATWTEQRLSTFRDSQSEFYSVFRGEPKWSLMSSVSSHSRADVFAKVCGIMSLMLSRSCPRLLREDQINGYYLRQ